MNILVRKASEQDIITIVDFQIKMAKETENMILSSEIISNGVKAVFGNKHYGQYFVAETKEGIVGSLLITYEWSDWRNALVWWLQSVYVKPEHRKAGVFRMMYQYVKGIVGSDETIAGIRLYMDKTNVGADKVYRAMGMDGDHYRVYEWMK